MSEQYRTTQRTAEVSQSTVTVQEIAERITSSVGQVILGKNNEIRLTALGLLSRGHILLEDIPGVGKTMMAKSLARAVGCTFKRIQFTPDMLPSDITGVSIFNPKTREFEFRPGPIMAQIVLADEINRATPKTQSAMLEAMEESQITVDGVTYRLSNPFLIMATQNPIEYEGTFPLPEAQLDRFMIRIQMGYPQPQDELKILASQQYQHPIHNLQQVVTLEELLTAQQLIKDVYVAKEVQQYIINLVTASRRHADVVSGQQSTWFARALPHLTGARRLDRARLRDSRRCKSLGRSDTRPPHHCRPRRRVSRTLPLVRSCRTSCKLRRYRVLRCAKVSCPDAATRYTS